MSGVNVCLESLNNDDIHTLVTGYLRDIYHNINHPFYSTDGAYTIIINLQIFCFQYVLDINRFYFNGKYNDSGAYEIFRYDVNNEYILKFESMMNNDFTLILNIIVPDLESMKVRQKYNPSQLLDQCIIGGNECSFYFGISDYQYICGKNEGFSFEKINLYHKNVIKDNNDIIVLTKKDNVFKFYLNGKHISTNECEYECQYQIKNNKKILSIGCNGNKNSQRFLGKINLIVIRNGVDR